MPGGGASAAAMATGAAASLMEKRTREARDAAALVSADPGRDNESDTVHGEGGEKLRNRKLLGLSTKEVTPGMMRSLFRLLDADGSAELSASEMQKGMLLLGFKEAADPVAMTCLLQDIDEDRTGTITEGEFMAFFATQNRRSVAERLKSYVLNQVTITATFYGVDVHGKHYVRVEDVNPKEFAEWVAALPMSRGRLWLDVVGYTPNVNATLAASLGMSPGSLAATILFNDCGTKLVQGVGGAPPVAQILVHCMKQSSDPLVKGGASGLLSCGRKHHHGEGPMGAYQLASKQYLVDNPPSISMEQAAILVTDDRTVVTVRAPVRSADGPSAPSVSSSAVAPAPVPSDEESQLAAIYGELRGRMQAKNPDTLLLFKASAKELAINMLDLILQNNFALRDNITDWQEVLEREIRKQPNSLHTPHLEALEFLAKNAERVLGPIAKALDPGVWPEDIEPPEPSVAEEELKDGSVLFNAKAVPLLRAWSSKKLLAEKAKVKVPLLTSSAQELPEGVAVGEDGKPVVTDPSLAPVLDESSYANLKQFFKAQLHEFGELAQDTRSLVKAIQEKADHIESLKRLLGSLKADFMNRTLFALTLITAVSVPITFLTGLWGMNFEDMRELRDPATLEDGSFGFGYKTFWFAFGTVILFEVTGMWLMGLFAALQ